MMVDPTGFWGDGFWGDAFLSFLGLSAMGLVLAACVLGVAIILVVALNEWRLWRKSRRDVWDVTTFRSVTTVATHAIPTWTGVNNQAAHDVVVFDWDWPAA